MLAGAAYFRSATCYNTHKAAGRFGKRLLRAAVYTESPGKTIKDSSLSYKSIGDINRQKSEPPCPFSSRGTQG